MKKIVVFSICSILVFDLFSNLKYESKNDSLVHLSDSLKKMGLYDLAVVNLYKVLNDDEMPKDNSTIIDTYNSLGLIFMDMGDFNNAKLKFNFGLRIASKINDSLKLSRFYNNLGILAQKELKIDSAILFYEKSLELKLKTADSVGISIVYTNLGTINIEQQNFQESLNYFNKSALIKQKLKDSFGLANLYNNIGNAFGYLGKLDSTKKYLGLGIVIAEKNNYLRIRSELYQNLAEFYKIIENYDKSIFYMEKHREIQEDIFDKTLATESAKQEIIFQVKNKNNELRVKQSEIVILNKEKEFSRKKNLIMWMIVLTLIGFIVLLIITLVYRVKLIAKNKLAYENQKQIDYLLLKREQQENIQLLSEKKQLEREIVVTTIENSRNKLTLRKLMENSNSEIDSRQYFLKEIKLLLSDNKEWKYFKLQFEKIHPSFFNQLTIDFPNLSQNDQRHIAYIKIGMTTKEISGILNIVPASVQKSRVRLKKKLNLAREDNLIKFIKNIGLS